MDSKMSWHEHIDYIALKASRRLGLLCRIRKYITIDVCKQLHESLVQPLYEYSDVVWANTDKSSLDRLFRLQKRGARIILKRKVRECSSASLFKELGWVSLYQRWEFHKCLTVFRCLNGFCPSYLRKLINLNSEIHNHNTRRRNNIHVNQISSRSGQRSFSFSAAKLYNDLSNTVKSSKSVRSFTSNYWLERNQ